MRDPRKEPKAGDIIRLGGVYGDYLEVTEGGLKFGDIRFVSDGIERMISASQWIEITQNAEVIRHVAD